MVWGRLRRRFGRRSHGSKLFQRLELREVSGRVGWRGRFRLVDCCGDLFGQVLLFHLVGSGGGEGLRVVGT